MTAIQTLAGVGTIANQTEAGYWQRIAAAAEILAGASSPGNNNVAGYMKRTATALEILSGGGGSPPNVIQGMNLSQPWYASNSVYTLDPFRFSGGLLQDGSGPIPNSNRDANGWINVVGAYRYPFQAPETLAPFQVNFTLGINATLTGGNCTVSNVNLAAGTCTITPSYAQPTNEFQSLNVTYNAGSTFITWIESGVFTTFNPNFLTKAQALMTAGGGIRVLDQTGVIYNQGHTDLSAFPPAIVTAATRKKLPNADWGPNNIATFRENDCTPFEFFLLEANAVGASYLHFNAPWNCDNGYLTVIAGLVCNGSTVTVGPHTITVPPLAGYLILEASNEVWNIASPDNLCTTQAAAEATGRLQAADGSGLVSDGFHMVERLCERTIEMDAALRPVFVAAGKLAQYKPVICFQNAGAARNAGIYLDYKPGGTTAVKDIVWAAGTGCYWGAEFTGTDLNALFALAPTSIDTTIDNVALLKAACDARGLKTIIYEGGNHTLLTDGPSELLFNADARHYEWEMYRLDQLGARCPGIIDNFYADYGAANSPWALMANSKDALAAANPKGLARADYKLGKRKLHTLSGTLAAIAGATVGTVLGTIKRRTMGSTVTLSSAAVSFVDPNARILTLQVADATAFTSAGTFNLSATESHSGDASGPVTTVLDFAIAANQTVLTSANGTSKSSHVAVSGSPALTFLTDGAGAINLVRASRGPATTKFQFEMTVTNTAGPNIFVGFDSGADDLSLDTAAPWGDGTGLIVVLNSTGFLVYWANALQAGNNAQANYWPAGTVLTVEGDETAHTMNLYRNGVLMPDNNIGGNSNYTIPTFSGYKAIFGGNNNGSNGGTVNFGATAFTHALSAGYAAYG